SEGELGLRIAGVGAGGEGEAHGAGRGGGATADGGDLLQVRALLGGGAADLLHDHGGGGAAAARSVAVAVGGEVVVDQHDLRLDGVVPADLPGDAEVQHVAGVVLDDLHHAPAGV